MMTGFRLNLSPLKEPLGFVKLVEWVSVDVYTVCVCVSYPEDREVQVFSLVLGFSFFPAIFTLEKNHYSNLYMEDYIQNVESGGEHIYESMFKLYPHVHRKHILNYDRSFSNL